MFYVMETGLLSASDEYFILWKMRFAPLFHPFRFPEVWYYTTPSLSVLHGELGSGDPLLSAVGVRAAAELAAGPGCESRTKRSWRGGTSMCCKRLLLADIRAPAGLPASQHSLSSLALVTRHESGLEPPLFLPC